MVGKIYLNAKRFIKRIVNSTIYRNFKSQKGQDKWVKKVFKSKRNGYFVELGAADGITHSNTYYLEKKLGWEGICIEPNPGFFKSLIANRNCTCFNYCVDSEAGTVSFAMNEQLGGIISEDTDNKPNYRDVENKRIELKTISLTDVLDRAKAPRIIDYFSLDVEGAEYRILKNFDFNTYQFNALTIERPNHALNQLLRSKGYVFIKNHLYDTFYVHESFPYLKELKKNKFEQIPPKNW